jgi:hypothetical protein
MPPIFYFACGARPCWRDVELAIACGQISFLVPALSRAANHLRRIPGIRVVLDSGAWPPDNPSRLSREAYARVTRAPSTTTPGCSPSPGRMLSRRSSR